MIMAIDTLGASHLATDGFEIQRTNNFEIQIELADDSERVRNLTLAVVSGFLPSESNEVINLNYGNTQITVAGAARVNNSGTLVVRDLIEKDTEKLIDEWRSLVYNKQSEAIGFAVDYKKTAKITQYAPDGTYLRVWNVEGLWPSAVDYGNISYESSGVKTISITLQYDKCTLDDRSEWGNKRNGTTMSKSIS